MIQIHSTLISNRLEYTLSYVFKDRMGIDFVIVSDISKLNENHTIINYNKESIGSGIHIIPEGFLFSKETTENLDDAFKFNLNHFEAKHDTYSDIFSGIFFHLSRYEEYNAAKDQLGRFSHKSSCLYINNYIHRPLIDEWICNFRNYLIQHHGFKPQDFKIEKFTSQATIDIDAVFSYKGRNVLRTLGGFAIDLIKLNFNELKKRMFTLIGVEKDPNDNFDLQSHLLNKKPAVYFIQVGKYGRLDKNISPENKEFKKIIQSLVMAGHEIGIHPSYNSNSDVHGIAMEKLKLESIIGKNVTHSRQHYLKLELPKTYRALIENGIEHDYSMGYSEIAGFRAATAHPFYWYDLISETSTKLLIHPFVVMDVAYKHFQKMTVEETITSSETLKEICRINNLPFVFVFHNESLSNHRGWENWEKVFSFWNHE